MSEPKYRVWIMHPVIDEKVSYDYHVRYELTFVVGAPFGVQDKIITEQDLTLLKAALGSLPKESRPSIFYQLITPDANDRIDRLIESGKVALENERLKREKELETQKKRAATIAKRKVDRELKKLAELQSKFGKTK